MVIGVLQVSGGPGVTPHLAGGEGFRAKDTSGQTQHVKSKARLKLGAPPALSVLGGYSRRACCPRGGSRVVVTSTTWADALEECGLEKHSPRTKALLGAGCSLNAHPQLGWEGLHGNQEKRTLP